MRKSKTPRPSQRKGTTADLAKELRLLAEAQRKTEESMATLAQAQARTEEQLGNLTSRVDALAEAQQRTEQRLEELAQAQARTEQRLEELAKAQQELVQAQARTEGTVRFLVEAVNNLRQTVGSLAENIGFGLEDIARVMLPGYLQRHLGLLLDGELERRFVSVEGEEMEINLYREGTQNGEKVVVIGECKSRIRSSQVEEFVARLTKIRKTLILRAVPVMVGYFIHPSGSEVAEKEGILLVASYQR